MGDQVVLVDAGGESSSKERGRELFELLGIEPPEDGGSVKVMVELLSPASPWGSPMRMRDEWAPFDLHEFAQKWGAGRYRFRVRKADGKWGQQTELVLAGPTKWEKKWRDYYTDDETGEVRRASEQQQQSSMPAGLETMLALQAKQQEMVMAMMQTMTTVQVETMKAQLSGQSKAADPVEAAAGVFGLVAKVRELAGDAPPEAKAGWTKVLEGLAPAAEAFGEALGRSIADESTKPSPSGDRKPAPESKQLPSGEGEAPSRARMLEVLRQVRASFERGSPPLLAAEIIEVVHADVAALIVEQGEEAIEAIAEQLGQHAPEFREGVGRRWVELVTASLLRSAVGEGPLDEACLAVDELERLEAEGSVDEPPGPQPVEESEATPA